MAYDDFTVVLPTLNEAKNIAPIIKGIRTYRRIRILVMDDGSTDGTCDIVKKLAKKYRNISLVNRKELNLQKGLTASVIDGFKKTKTKYAIVMDADMQHPVEKVGELASALLEGADLAVAVRTKISNWPFYRKLISKILITLGYLVLLLRGDERCGDIFSGFFGIRRDAFTKTYSKNHTRFVPGGYKVLFDFLKCISSGSLTIAEIPYTFGIRKADSSKAGIKQGLLVLKSFIT